MAAANGRSRYAITIYAVQRGLTALAALLWLFGKALWHFWRGFSCLPPGRTRRNLGDGAALTVFRAVRASGYIALENRAASEMAV